MADGQHRHELIDVNAERITELERKVSDLTRRVTALEGEQPGPPPPPPPELPFEGEQIGGYSSGVITELDPTWHTRCNAALATWNRMKDFRFETPVAGVYLDVPANPDYGIPIINSRSVISWDHDGSKSHSQVRLRIEDDRMGRGTVYLQQGRRYGLSCDCTYVRMQSWINMLQLYGRVHETLSNGFKDVAAFFYGRSGIYGHCYDTDPIGNRGNSYLLSLPSQFRLALDVLGGLQGHANFWLQRGADWELIYAYRGPVGTGQDASQGNYFWPGWGAYSKRALGRVAYDNLAIWDLE